MGNNAMRNTLLAVLGLVAGATASAEDLTGAERFLCSAATAMLCVETAECFTVTPWEADIPQFVVVDVKRGVISTTRASAQRRSTPIRNVHRDADRVFLQGAQAGRAFSFVIEEVTGLMTVAVLRDGVTVNVFGACTDADVRASE